eukprot:Filipodium_phascolosomae@DN6805_c0_g1_i1.p1
MSSNHGEEKRKGSHNVVDSEGRRRWDKEYFAEKARLKGDDEDLDFLPKKKAREAPPPDARTFLKQREKDLNLEERLGKKEVVTAYTSKEAQGGYWCHVCECLIKDSQAWLDHINGKKHNRMLGMSMRVERVGVEQVRNKLKALKRAGERSIHDSLDVPVEDIESRLEELKRQEEERIKRRKEKKLRKKEEQRKRQSEAHEH